MSASEVDLANLFNQVTELLKGKQDALNEADSINHDHGTHMVHNFRVITAALEQKRGASPAEQLAFASQALKQSSTSGSAQLYSQGLTRAASKLEGHSSITGENALGLVQALLGGEEQPALELEDKSKASGSTIENLLEAGSAYMQAKQEGDSSVEALIKAFMSGKESSHQSQSGQVVGGGLLEVITGMLGGEEEKAKPKKKPKTTKKTKPKTKPKPKKESKTKPKKTTSKKESKAKPKPKKESKPKPKKTKEKPKAKPKPKSTAKPKTKPKS